MWSEEESREEAQGTSQSEARQKDKENYGEKKGASVRVCLKPIARRDFSTVNIYCANCRHGVNSPFIYGHFMLNEQ